MNKIRTRLALFALVLLPSLLVGAEHKAPVIGQAQSAPGMMLRRAGEGKPWLVVKEKEELHGGNLVLGLSGASILSTNGAVQLTLLSNLDGKSPYPIIEAAVLLPTTTSKADLEFTLDRGRVDLINRKEKGEATVRVLVQGQPWEFTLEKPGTRVALELFGRWPRGPQFTPKPGPTDVPHASLVILVIEGEIAVKFDRVLRTMQAPPGAAMLQWDNLGGVDPSPRKLEMLPEWALGTKPTAEYEKIAAVRKKARQALATKSVGELIDEFINSDNPYERRFAVLVMGALDDLPRLAQTLSKASHADVWDAGVLALRHWIGRGPGQDVKLYRSLLERKVPPVQAETIMALLHSFSEEDLTRPETYEVLVGYLNHDSLGIRGLAYWHLSRLYPEGKELGYNPLAPKDERDAARAKWRKLLTTGKLPPQRTEK